VPAVAFTGDLADVIVGLVRYLVGKMTLHLDDLFVRAVIIIVIFFFINLFGLFSIRNRRLIIFSEDVNVLDFYLFIMMRRVIAR